MGHIIRPIANTTSAPLVAVPDDVAEELEALYVHLTENPDQVAFAEFDTPAERKDFLKQAKTWGKIRDGGELDVQQLRSNHLPETQVRFTIKVPSTPEEIEARRKEREAAEAKRAKSGPGKPGRPAKPKPPAPAFANAAG